MCTSQCFGAYGTAVECPVPHLETGHVCKLPVGHQTCMTRLAAKPEQEPCLSLMCAEKGSLQSRHPVSVLQCLKGSGLLMDLLQGSGLLASRQMLNTACAVHWKYASKHELQNLVPVKNSGGLSASLYCWAASAYTACM